MARERPGCPTNKKQRTAGCWRYIKSYCLEDGRPVWVLGIGPWNMGAGIGGPESWPGRPSGIRGEGSKTSNARGRGAK